MIHATNSNKSADPMTNRENSNKKGIEYLSLILMTLSASAMAVTCTYEEHINCPLEITNTEPISKSK